MKVVSTAIAAAIAAAALSTPAFAEEGHGPSVTGYVNLGYSYVDMDPAKLHALGGRLGARFGKYFAAEGEAGFGIGTDRVVQSGFTIDTKIKSHFAGYGVVYLPLSPQADVFARVGYGHSSLQAKIVGASATGTAGENSVNYGGGAQYFFTMHDGLRADFTHFAYRNGGGSANLYSIAYVRRFP